MPPRVVATDGGQVLDESVDERPDNCECWDTDTGLLCFACWMAGFDAPNPDGGGE